MQKNKIKGQFPRHRHFLGCSDVTAHGKYPTSQNNTYSETDVARKIRRSFRKNSYT